MISAESTMSANEFPAICWTVSVVVVVVDDDDNDEVVVAVVVMQSRGNGSGNVRTT